MLTHDEMIEAMRRNDTSYNGKYYVCVKSTKIYCLPSCPAKLPMLKNVIFMETREEAIGAGFRGCRRCKSEMFPDILPKWLFRLIKYMRQHRSDKLNENSLMKITGVEISTIRRYFKNHLATTPLAFHRKLRLNHAMMMIKKGSDYLSAAYECGWESSSGFREAFTKQFGQPPGGYYVKQ